MKFEKRPVFAVDELGDFVGEYPSQKDAAKVFDVTPSAIRMNIIGKSSICQGCRFYLVPEEVLLQRLKYKSIKK